jgi:hypothetical protein
MLLSLNQPIGAILRMFTYVASGPASSPGRTSSLMSGPGTPVSYSTRLVEWIQTCAAGILGMLLGSGKRLHLPSVIGHDRRVIEVDAESDALGNALIAAGWRQYLRLRRGARPFPVSNEAIENKLQRRTVTYRSAEQIHANNAEVLVFSGQSAWHFRYTNYRHSEFALWAPRFSLSTIFGIVRLVRNAAGGRIEVLGRVSLPVRDGRVRSFLVGRVTNRVQRNARRYLSPFVSTERFFDELSRFRIRYAVLRWFETLPEIEAGEDIDLLVADEQVEIVLDLLDSEPGVVPVDVYSASGMAGTDYRSMAYYLPPLARQILAEAVLHKGRFRVPNLEHHFLSLAYHVVYHKAEASGLRRNATDVTAVGGGDHDYARVLSQLAAELDISPEITLEGLDAFLAARGWRPPLDTLDRLAEKSGWLRSRLIAWREEAMIQLKDTPALRHDGFTVFFLREKALEHGLEQVALKALESDFIILRTAVLDAAARQRVRTMVRGANWNKGPWPASGGGPAMLIVAVDPDPINPSAALKATYPTLTNARVQNKGQLRDRLNERLTAEQRCNMIHSSDSGPEAAYYLSVAAPELLGDISRQVEEAVGRLGAAVG